MTEGFHRRGMTERASVVAKRWVSVCVGSAEISERHCTAVCALSSAGRYLPSLGYG